jgi:hypothetical protein
MAGGASFMTDACHHLHEVLSRLPRLRSVDSGQVPANGIYVLFENGETAHGGDRIVRIGTHRGQGQLPGRLKEHLYKENKDRSIFRKHVGRCQLAKAGDPFLDQWELDRTTKAARNNGTVDSDRLQKTECDVTRYMTGNFSFATLRFESKKERLEHETQLLSTIHACPDCGPSKTWLGKFHPTQKNIRDSGLWNVQGLSGPTLSLADVRKILSAGLAAS